MTKTGTKPSLGEWFCLSAGRESFTINPETDRQHLFGDKQWAEDIKRHLQRSLVLNEPVRLVWVGQYGIGKTHRLFHTVHLVETEPMDFLPVYVVCADITTLPLRGRGHGHPGPRHWFG